MKLAVIGTGFWGKNHVREYLALGHEVTACDLAQESVQKMKDDFNVHHTSTNLDAVFADPDIKGVSICVPNQFHFSIAKKALEAGKHVLLEKPMTLKTVDCEILNALAEEKGLVLNVGHIFRFNNAVKKIKEMVENNEFGKVYTCKLVWTNLEQLFPDRDILFDLAPHAFDILNYIFGKNPDEVYAIGKDFRREGGEEAAFINAILDGMLINLEMSWITPKKVRTVTIVGEKKTAFVELLSQEIDLYEIETGETKSIPIEQTNPLVEELKQFVDSVETGSKSPASGKAGRDVVHIIEKSLESLREKKIITLSHE